MSTQYQDTPDGTRPVQRAQKLDTVCDDFERAWLAGQRPKIEDYVAETDVNVRGELFEELLISELRLQVADGIAPDRDQYVRRFPALEALIDQIFGQAHGAGTSPNRPVKTSGPAATGSGGLLSVRCPHCHNPIEIVVDACLDDITCSTCRSHFSLVQDATTTRDASKITTVGHFELIERLGLGGFGTVWKTRDRQLDRTVAVKIPRHGQLGPVDTEKFLREARAIAQLNHPNIVRVYEVGRDGDSVYIVSDLVRGVSLADRLTAARFTAREAAALCEKIAAALDHAHMAGVVHRDLKPQNIMIDEKGEPILMDFGLARRETGEVTVTIDGQLLGTPAYMSPEQAQGEAHHADRRSDVYSLGVILFELLTGERPFRGNSRMLIHQVIHDEPPSPRRLSTTVPRDLETICLKCLEKDPEKRYLTAEALAEDLHRYSRGEPILARPVTQTARAWRWCKRNPMGTTVIGLLILSAIAGPLVSIRQTRLAAEAEEATARADAKSETLRRNLYAYHISRAAAAYDANSTTKIRELLDGCPDDLRGWEWARLNWLVSTPGMIAISGRERSCFIPNTRRIISYVAGDNEANAIGVWDADTGDLLRTFGQHDDYPGSGALSADGKKFVVGTNNGTIVLWEVASGRLLWRVYGAHTQRLDGLAFSPDSTTIASVSWDGTLKTWNAADGENRFAKTLDHRLRSVSFSPKGDRIVTAAWHKERSQVARVWDAATGRELFTLDGVSGNTSTAAFSPGGKWIATGTGLNIGIWNAETGLCVRTLAGHSGDVLSVAISPDGSLIASGATDGSVRLWDVATWTELGRFRGNRDNVYWLSFSPDSRKVAVFGWPNDGILVWAVSMARPDVMTLRGHEGSVLRHASSPDGRQLVSVGTDGTVRQWDVISGRQLRCIDGTGSPLESVAYHPNGNSIAAGGEDGTITLWNAATGQPVERFTGHEGTVNCLAFSPDGSRLVSGSEDNTLRVWDVATGHTVQVLPELHDGPVVDVAYSPDGSSIASCAFGERTLTVCDALTGQVKQVLGSFAGSVRALAFSPDESLVAAGVFEGTTTLWHLDSGEELCTLRRHGSPVNSIAFSPDGQRVFSASSDRTIKVWNPATADELLTLDGHGDEIASICVSRDGRTITSASFDGTLKVWETEVLPPVVYGTRRTVAATRRIVDLRLSELTIVEKVIDSLRGDETLQNSVRDVALQIATTRKEGANIFNRDESFKPDR